MLVTQNNDGSLSVEISAADMVASVNQTLARNPATAPNIVNLMVVDLGMNFIDAVRAANVAFDQAMTDVVATKVQVLAADRQATIDAQAKVGP
jgi:hypothetical protein